MGAPTLEELRRIREERLRRERAGDGAAPGAAAPTPRRPAPTAPSLEQLRAVRERRLAGEQQSPAEPPAPPAVDPYISAARGGLQGVSLSFGDEIAGAALGASDFLGRGVAKLIGADVPADAPSPTDIYRTIRDQERAANTAAYDANPAIYLGSEIAGGIASPVPFGKVKLAGQTGKAAAKAIAKAGAKSGAAIGLGSSEADLTRGDVGGPVVDTALGAATGYVVPRALQAAANKAKGAGAKLTRVAEIQAVKALGAIGTEMRKLGLTKAREIGRVALDEGIVSPLASAETMLGRAESLSDESGAVLGRIRAHLEALDPLTANAEDALSLAKKLRQELFDYTPNDSEGKLFRKQLSTIIGDVFANVNTAGRRGQPAISPVQLAKLKGVVQRMAYTDPLLATENLQGALRPRSARAAGVIQEAEENLVRRADRSVLPEFLENKTKYGASLQARALLERRLGRDIGNNEVFNLPNMLALSTAVATGSPGALAYPVGVRSAYRWGNQLTATGSDMVGAIFTDVIAPALQGVADQGPAAVRAMGAALAQEYPALRAKILEFANAEELPEALTEGLTKQRPTNEGLGTVEEVLEAMRRRRQLGALR